MVLESSVLWFWWFSHSESAADSVFLMSCFQHLFLFTSCFMELVADCLFCPKTSTQYFFLSHLFCSSLHVDCWLTLKILFKILWRWVWLVSVSILYTEGTYIVQKLRTVNLMGTGLCFKIWLLVWSHVSKLVKLHGRAHDDLKQQLIFTQINKTREKPLLRALVLLYLSPRWKSKASLFCSCIPI